jgi:hypothetical protein
MASKKLHNSTPTHSTEKIVIDLESAQADEKDSKGILKIE